ncbi:MAG: FHA domain-containing protein [Acidobacteria bacterium]|nr:MAG: FHA domain-containing protein [Acidobacteriota bacterium]
MTPKLIAITGPLQGTTFALTEETISIGRESSNDLTVADPSVSRHHCLIARETTGYEIKDLKSLNGTFIDHKAIARHILQHGDYITVGTSTFLFILDKSERSPLSHSVQLKNESRTGESTAPLQMNDTRCTSLESLSDQPTSMIRPCLQDPLTTHGMVGESDNMRRVYRFIAKVAPTDSTVLICGETGTGKELAARALHRNSYRADHPFVAINCATLSETLLESELFGHERGAFTGAIARKKGKLEGAHGGTVLLDEIGEMAPALQAKLLRVLEEREFERVGGTHPIEANVRFIAATNKDLERAVAQGAFREDLYYRLNVVGLRMPLLRDCRDDIPLLVDHFIAHYNKVLNRQIKGIAPEARDGLMSYHWPGNVRELRNVIERAFVLGSSHVIRPDDLPEAVLARVSLLEAMPPNYHHALQELKKDLIVQAVEQANGNYTEAAKLLGLHPNYLHRLIRNLDLKSTLKQRTNPLMRR